MKTLILASLFLSLNAFAWGPTGHRAVGEIAQGMLSVQAGLKVHQLLDGRSLAQVSTWPDEIKSEPQTYKHTYNWHYTDWPDEMTEHNEHNSSGQLLTQLGEQLRVLKDAGASKEKKVFALKFVVHLMGDLHMPLHVGNGQDQGGNNCKVTFHKNPTNLHALWDENMIDFTRLSFTELAKFAKAGLKIDEVQSWKKGSFVDWAAESKAIRNSIYPEDTKTYCRKDVTESEQPKLGFEYSYKFMPVAEKRILQAGVRLAHLLNENL